MKSYFKLTIASIKDLIKWKTYNFLKSILRVNNFILDKQGEKIEVFKYILV